MKLYFLPGACSCAVHIILEEINANFELIYVGKKSDNTTLEDFYHINPLKSVPTLELDNNLILTQNISILEYLADLNPTYKLLAPLNSYDRTKIIKWLSFVATDIHKSFSPLFLLNTISKNPETQNEIIRWSMLNIDKYFTILDNHLKDRSYLVCERFTIADAYLFVVFQWTKYTKIKTDKFHFLEKYISSISTRKSIQKALQTEKHYF